MTTRIRSNERERAAKAIVEWFLCQETRTGGYSAREVREALCDEFPFLTPPPVGETCDDTNVSAWRRTLREAERKAFDLGWYLTQVPGGRADTRVLTQDPKRINESVLKLLQHAKTRVQTANGYVAKVGEVMTVLPPDIRATYGHVVRKMNGIREDIELIEHLLERK